MNIVLANLDPGTSLIRNSPLKKRFSTLHFPIGLGIIASVLKQHGWIVSVHDSYVNGDNLSFLDRIRSESPDVLLLSGFLGNYYLTFIKNILDRIKGISKDITTIMGGPLASCIPQVLLDETKIDYIVIGEGEITIVELLDAIEKNISVNKIPGIAFRDQKKCIAYGPQRERIENIDTLPYPLYNFFNIDKYLAYLNQKNRCWEISSSRGCYNSCHFCHRIFGRKVTYHSPNYIIDHMQFIKKKYGINRINFVDDNFVGSKSRIDSFLGQLGNCSDRFIWRFQGRIDRVDKQMIMDMVKTGLTSVSFGIESGSESMLNRLGKKINLDEALHKLYQFQNMTTVYTSFIVGGPKEDWNTINETIDFIKKAKLRHVSAGILTPFPGTKIYQKAVDSNMITNEYNYCKNIGPVYDFPYLNMSNLSDEELLIARDMVNNAVVGN